jgi:hypothetical protein
LQRFIHASAPHMRAPASPSAASVAGSRVAAKVAK